MGHGQPPTSALPFSALPELGVLRAWRLGAGAVSWTVAEGPRGRGPGSEISVMVRLDLSHGASEHADAPEGARSQPVEQEVLPGSAMFALLTGRQHPVPGEGRRWL